MARDLRFRVLGPLEVSCAKGAVPITAPRHRRVLAALLAQPNRIVQLEWLARVLWGEELPRSARAQIYICISALRQALGGEDCIETHSTGYALRLDDDALDSQVFERLLDEVRGIDTGAQPQSALRLLEDALALWRGPAFDGVSSSEIEAKATWLEQRRALAIEQRVELLLQLGREDAHEIADLCATHPLRERLHAFLMVSLYRSGRQAEALDVYRKVRQMLVKELGIEPGVMLQTIHQAILNQDPFLDLPRAHGAGAHRIVLVPRQLPVPVADFTGRDDIAERLCGELNTAGQLVGGLPRPSIALVTGIAGVGKSSLAMHVAHRVVSRFPDGQLFARLAGSTTSPVAPAEVLEWFLRALGVDARDIPEHPERRADLLRSVLGGRRVLIVLDNAASEAQVRPLLPGLPGCAVIVTSRRRLPDIPGASVWELGTLSDAEARTLLDRIVPDGRVRDDPLAAEILAICGGLPLALRIAGLRLAAYPHWGAADLIRRVHGASQALDQFSFGDISVRNVLSGSYDALSPAARRIFRLLGLLKVPDFASWAAVVAVGMPLQEIDPLLDELVESRLLNVDVRGKGPARYSFHTLTRLFAAELAGAEDPSADQFRPVDNVLRACLTFVRAAQCSIYGDERAVFGPIEPSSPGSADTGDLVRDPAAWFCHERATLLALVGYAAETGRHELAWNLAVGCTVFFEILGCFDDWERTHRLALDAVQHFADTRGEAALLCSLGSLGVARGDWSAVGGLLRAMSIFEAVGDKLGRALTLSNLASFDVVHGSCASAVARYHDACTCFQEVGDPVGEAYAMSGLAHAYAEAGDLRSAQQFAEASLVLARKLKNPRLEALVLCRLGEVLATAGCHDVARGHLAEALDRAQVSGDQLAQAQVLAAQAESLVALGELGAADEILHDVIVLCDRIGHLQLRARATLTRAQILQIRGAFSEAESLIVAATAVFSGNGAATWYGRALMALSDLRRRSGSNYAYNG
jgi:DNA-binding SARP family transcriptional activator/tetratricopeptide (TPR) repeat protein